MQPARNYIATVTHNMERALTMMPAVEEGAMSSLPTTKEEINAYVEALLAPKEQFACDRATD